MRITKDMWARHNEKPEAAFTPLLERLMTVFATKFDEVVRGEGIDKDVHVQFTCNSGDIGVSPKMWIQERWRDQLDVTDAPDFVCRCDVLRLRHVFYGGLFEYEWLKYILETLPRRKGYIAAKYIAIHEAAHVVDELTNNRSPFECSDHDEQYAIILERLVAKYIGA